MPTMRKDRDGQTGTHDMTMAAVRLRDVLSGAKE